jgi:hypothetical protein
MVLNRNKDYQNTSYSVQNDNYGVMDTASLAGNIY